MLNAAIVGLGRWGRTLVSSVQNSSSSIRFVCGVDPQADGAAAFDLAGVRRAADLDEVLRDRAVDAVVLATPHSLHRDQVIRCAEAGKPVFCEKPLALTVRDALAMISACRDRGVVLGVGHNRRFWPSYGELKRLAGCGELGELLHI